MSLPHLLSLHLDVAGAGALVAASRAWWRGITSHVRLGLLREQFGNEEGAWLARCSPQKRTEALRQLAAIEAPRVHSCRLHPGDAEHESHSIIALPRVAWPGGLDGDTLGVMIVFGGVRGRAFEPLAGSSLISVRGRLHDPQLEASCQPLELDPVPPPRFSHAAMWLSDLSSMAVYGGRRSADNHPDAALGDLWLLERTAISTDRPGWRWREVSAAGPAAPRPAARCHFASCELSGRSFFVHGGHTCQPKDGLLDDAWVCWIDDGFDDLDGFGALDGFSALDEPPSRMSSVAAPSEAAGGRRTASRPCSRQVSPLSRQVSDQLSRQVSDSYRRLAPQVALSPSLPCSAAPAPEEAPVAAVWRRVEADGPPPPRCCGHAAARCRDGVVIHGVWSGSSTSHCLGPVHVLEGLAEPRGGGGGAAGGRRPRYSRLLQPRLSACRPLATLHLVAGHPVLVGGWGDADLPDSAKRAWHASCKLPMSDEFGPMIAVFGGRDFKGNTCADLLVLNWLTK